MFGMFKKKKPILSGAELAEEGLRQVAIAIKNSAIDLEQGRVFDDIYVHADKPDGKPRITYVMFSPSIQNQVLARCAIILDRVQGKTPVWQIDWAVEKAYRGQGFGMSVAAKALAEFTNGMRGKLENGFIIEAVVDEGNESSNRIARSLIGNEQVIFNKKTSSNVHSFLRRFNE